MPHHEARNKLGSEGWRLGRLRGWGFVHLPRFKPVSLNAFMPGFKDSVRTNQID
jgi:hypothetical protein